MTPTALITGAGRGIGRAIALNLARTHNLVLVGKTRAHLEETADLCAKDDLLKCEVVPFDLAKTHELPTLVKDLKSPNINLLVNNAGLCVETSIYHADLAKWDEAMAVNLRSVINLTHLLLPQLRLSKQRFGTAGIINLSSTSGHRAYANGANYCATKWGLNGFTAALFEDVRYDDIKVCSICPGFVNTDIHANSKLNGSLMIQPEDIARTVRFVVDFPTNACPTEITIYPQKDPRGRR